MSEKTKVLHIMHSRKCGGAERHVVLLTTQLVELGCEVAVACPKNSWVSENLSHNVTQYPIRMRGFYDLSSFLRLLLIIRKYDLVHAHLQRSSYYAKLACKCIAKPVVYTAHASNAHKHFPDRADIIAVSNAVKLALPRTRFRSVQVVRNGVKDMYVTHSKSKLRNNYGLKGSELAICMIARLEAVKGHDVLLKALQLLHDVDIRVFFAGDLNTSFACQLQKQAGSLPVQFLGHVEQPEFLLGAMDLLVAPSRREAISLTILEACSAKVPSVASNIDGIPEAVADGETGYLFPVEDHIALATRIREIALNKECIRGLGEAARKKYLSQFTEKIMAEGTRKVYDRVLKH